VFNNYAGQLESLFVPSLGNPTVFVMIQEDVKKQIARHTSGDLKPFCDNLLKTHFNFRWANDFHVK